MGKDGVKESALVIRESSPDMHICLLKVETDTLSRSIYELITMQVLRGISHPQFEGRSGLGSHPPILRWGRGGVAGGFMGRMRYL